MHCVSYREQLSAFTDDELDSHEVRLLHDHLDRCSSCRQEFEFLRSTQTWLREAAFAVALPKPPANFSARVMSAIRDDAEPTVPLQAWGPSRRPSRLAELWEVVVDRSRLLVVIPRYALSVASLLMVAAVALSHGLITPQTRHLTTVYELGNQPPVVAMQLNDSLEEALQELAYHSTSEPTLEGGAWVALAQVRFDQ